MARKDKPELVESIVEVEESPENTQHIATTTDTKHADIPNNESTSHSTRHAESTSTTHSHLNGEERQGATKASPSTTQGTLTQADSVRESEANIQEEEGDKGDDPHDAGELSDPESDTNTSAAIPPPKRQFKFITHRHEQWHIFNLVEFSAWKLHTLYKTDRKPGVRVIFTKTESHGPKTMPYTVYNMHIKTAFTVRGVCKRYRDFKELNDKLRAIFDYTPPLPSSQWLGKMLPKFVFERRKKLQAYMDELLSLPQLANTPEVKNFLGLTDAMIEDGYKELPDEFAHVREKQYSDAEESTMIAGVEAVVDGYRKAADTQGEAVAANRLGMLLALNHDFSRAFEALERSLELCTELGEERGKAVVLSNMGCVQLMRLPSLDALSCFQQSLRCWNSLNLLDAQSDCLLKLSMTCAVMSEYEAAIEYAIEATQLCTSAGDTLGEAECLALLGDLYFTSGEVRQAVDSLELCLQLRRKLKDKVGLAETLNRLGLAFSGIGYYLHAMDYFEQTLALCQESGDTEGEAIVLFNLGHVYTLHGNLHCAVDFYEKSLVIRTKWRYLAGQVECHIALTKVHFSMGDMRRAKQHFEHGDSLLKSLANSEVLAELCELVEQTRQRLTDQAAANGGVPGEDQSFDGLARPNAHPSNELLTSTPSDTNSFDFPLSFKLYLPNRASAGHYKFFQSYMTSKLSGGLKQSSKDKVNIPDGGSSTHASDRPKRDPKNPEPQRSARARPG